MTALTTGLGGQETFGYKRMTYLLTGAKVFQGSKVGMILKGANFGKITKYTATSNMLYLGQVYLGQANGSIDATSVDKACQVDMPREIAGLRWMPQGAVAVVAAQLLQLAYLADDNTVVAGSADLGVSAVGRILGIDATKGVLIREFGLDDTSRDVPTPGPVFVYTANDFAPVAVVCGARYVTPVTGAASTITLPDAALLPDDTFVEFFANGTLNGHTITFRDAGTANASIRAAYTASKRFLARFKVVTGIWVDAFGAVGA